MNTRLLIFVSALLLCTVLKAKAQHRVYVGGQFGLGLEYQSKTDPTNLVYATKRFGHSPYGATMRYELDDKYGIEVGLIKEPLMRDVLLRGIDFETKFEAGFPTISYVRIPMRLHVKALGLGNKAALRIFGGASHLRYLFDTDRPFSQESGDFDQDIRSLSKKFYILDKYTWMLEGGTSLTYKLTNKINVDASVNYMGGFADLTRTDVRYKTQGRPEQQATVISRGDKLSFNIGVRYRVLELRRLND